jgi:hypothetical protein
LTVAFSVNLGTAATCPGSDTGYVWWVCNGSWVELSVSQPPATACTNGTTSSSLACTTVNTGTYAYTDGTKTTSSPAVVWSSSTTGEGATCSGDFADAVKWRCTGMNPTYY